MTDTDERDDHVQWQGPGRPAREAIEEGNADIERGREDTVRPAADMGAGVTDRGTAYGEGAAGKGDMLGGTRAGAGDRIGGTGLTDDRGPESVGNADPTLPSG